MHIHIFGASGSGTTTLGNALSARTAIPLFDADDYFWVKTDPPFVEIRPREERQSILKKVLSEHDSWILSGSMTGWGDFLIPELTLAVYLYIPQIVRMERLMKREKERYGSRIEPGNDMHKAHSEFIEWAKSYDEGGMEIRSRMSHREWMKKLQCMLVTIEYEMSIGEEVAIILDELRKTHTVFHDRT